MNPRDSRDTRDYSYIRCPYNEWLSLHVTFISDRWWVCVGCYRGCVSHSPLLSVSI